MQIMAQLHRDHDNLRKLLAILKHKQRKLKTGTRPNFQLMRDVVDYIIDYSDNHHHALEDVIFGFMIERHPEEQETFTAIMEEHRSLKQQTAELRECIDHILMDAIIPMDEFADQLGVFVDQQLHHIQLEERRIFPLIERMVNDTEWQQLVQALPDQEDPLFGKIVATEYQRLYTELLEDQQEDQRHVI